MHNKGQQRKAKVSKDIYEMYCSTTKAPVAYKTFREILTKYNKGIVEHLLDGGELNMGNKLSTIEVVRRKRDPRSPRINWNLSFKLKAELEKEGVELFDKVTGKGEHWLVYFTDEQYFRYKWSKNKCMVKNRSVYSFVPTRGKDGNKEKLSALIKNDDLAYLKFTKNDGNI